MSDSKRKPDAQRDAEVGRGEETQAYGSADAVVRVLDEYLAALKAGQAPSRDELLARHPEMASQLEACLAGLDFIHEAQASTRPHQKIGDFRIVREVGRGGMGAVFEAIQMSLGRRVALKILRFSPTSDRGAVERFQREAETVATLHHTNIVPIFFVGSEKGVNYYAMQFIEGRNLAEVIADRDTEIPPQQVAAWGLQAAEALAHAHRRGVIHRDVKPSNLILDQEDRLWLTDFGLARRLDDVTLSLSGMLLGTPRYMSPEHARASTKRIDHRSDIFSLGATLYELLTRTPAFPGDAAHDVIQHILAGEPTPIRKLNPAVPRDLETVVMKCLAKEPSSRYASADDLAADLRAVLDDRPIRARRASSFELATRWLKQNQRSVSQVSTAAMVTLAVTLTTLLTWTSYKSWNMAGVRLGAVNPPLVAEILDAEGNAIRTETLPMQAAVSLPAGQYDVRVSADGTLSQTFGISLDRGRSDAQYTVNVADQWLLAPRPIEHKYDMLDTRSEQTVMVWGKDGITVHQLHGPPTSWTLELSPATASALNAFPGYTNPRQPNDAQVRAFGETNETRPWIVHELMDVNGDGVGDIVCAARHQAWMMAISGTGQGVLWFAGLGRDLTMTSDQRARSGGNQITQSSVLYPPALCDDLDGDGTRDLVVAVADLDSDFHAGQNTYACRRWLQAISGRSGESIWRCDLADELFALSPGEEVPEELRWFHVLFRGRMSQGGNATWLGQHYLRSPPRLEQTGSHAYLPTAPYLLNIDGRPSVALAAGKELLVIDAQSGKTRGEPVDLSFRPSSAICWRDVDGDGLSDMVALEEVHTAQGETPEPNLVVWSLAKAKPLWSKRLDAFWPGKRGWSIAGPDWPLVADLDGDGQWEIVVPDGRSHRPGAFSGGAVSQQIPSGKLAVYDSATGTPKWTRTLVTLDAQVDYFIDGPDLDGDGTRELFAATCDPKAQSLYVDALSGASGKTLWTGTKSVPGDSKMDSFRIIGLQWWHSGADGWPQLAVSLGDHRYYTETALSATVLTFSAGTGKLISVGREIAELLPADVDRDGAEDLIVCSNEIKAPNSRGSLHCIRGVARQPWKRLASLGEPAGDIDRDGVRDFVRSWGDGTLLATSGATGREIWRSRAVRSVHELEVYAPGDRLGTTASSQSSSSLSDLDRDGIDDMIVCETLVSVRRKTPLHAISGRTGKRIWSLDEVAIQSINGVLATEIVDLEGDGTPEVLWLAAIDYRYPPSKFGSSNNDVQLWLFAVSGRSGQLRWAQSLSPAYGSSVVSTPPPLQFRNVSIRLVTADMNSDGVLDVVAPAVLDDGSLETRVLEGKQGELLWRRARQDDGLGRQALENRTSPVVCDVEGDGKPELVFIEPYVGDATQSIPRVDVAVTLLDAAGAQVWTKPTGTLFTHFSSNSHHKGDLLTPLVIQTPKQTQADSDARRSSRIVVVLPGEPKIVSFDSSGAAVERKLAHSADLSKVFACDVDDDGQEELFFMDRGTVYATPADDLEHVLWQRALGELGMQQILDVREGSDAFPPLVIARTDATDNSVVALDARSGQPVWNCPGPIARGFDSGTYLIHTAADVLEAPAPQPPLVCFQYEFINDCRQGFLASSSIDTAKSNSATSAQSLWSARGTTRLPAMVAGLKSDPRWRRPLPWHADLAAEPRTVAFILWSLFFAATLVVLPACYGIWLVVRRRFQVSHLLLLPVVAAVFVQAALITAPYDNDFNTFAARLSIALIFSPPILALGLLVRWAIQRRWRRIGLWLTVLLVGSLVMAVISIRVSL
ncbi:MAG: protein kinase domain-containing protein, partial [Aureliella sp.]